MRISTAAAILAALTLLAGCGDSGDGPTSTPAVDDGQAWVEQVRADWEAAPSCKRPPGASRWGCSVGSLRCQGVVTDRGWTISCSEPGRSVAFVIRR